MGVPGSEGVGESRTGVLIVCVVGLGRDVLIVMFEAVCDLIVELFQVGVVYVPGGWIERDGDGECDDVVPR